MADEPTGQGWQPDPTGRHELRWWDGANWGDFVSDNGVPGSDPLPAPPTEPTAVVPEFVLAEGLA